MPKTSSKSRGVPPASFSPRFVANVKSQQWAKQTSLDAQRLKQRLTRHRDQAVKKFELNYPEATSWLKARNLDLSSIRLHSHRLLTGAGLSTALLLSAPTSPKALPQKPAQVRLAEAGIAPIPEIIRQFLDKLKSLIPNRIGHLDHDIETQVQQLILDTFGIKAASTLDGQRLNHSLGWIGYEQHLYRYPGDSLSLHEEGLQAGIAPHVGAWGYFASSKNDFTEQLKNYEKYYVAVQTLYLPTWEKDLKFLINWYKYRKVLVVDVDSGRAVVAVIADSGPAAWVGKQFGGSPEVMAALDLTGKKSKGKVLLWFVDDPDNKIPVGPVTGKVGERVELI